MDILNSDWLINMLKKSSKSPHERLLSLFDILGDWLNAPNVAESLRANIAQNQTSQAISSILEAYLSQQAALAGAEEPEMLAHQLYFMLLAAIQESVRSPQPVGFSKNSTSSFTHAKNAAIALITAQTKPKFYIKKSSAYAIAASFFGVSIVVGSLWAMNGFNLTSYFIRSNFNNSNATIAENKASTTSAVVFDPNLVPSDKTSQLIASPEQTATLFATLEQMRKGSCQFPEALQLPDSYKAIYIENILGGNVSSKVTDQKIIMQILQKVRCNYTPMLMENSKS